MDLIFNESTKTILLSVKSESIDLGILANSAREKNLFPKHEFHITLIGKQTGGVLMQKNIDFAAIENLAQKIDWQFTLKHEFYFCTKTYPDGEIRNSIIQLIELPSLADFYRRLNLFTQENFFVPFSHITLCTNSTLKENVFRGIGIYSEEDFKNLSPEHLL